MHRRKLLSLMKLAVVVQLLLLDACSGNITISVDKQLPPTFTFSRNFAELDYLPMFYVSEVDPENVKIPYTKERKDNKMIWQITPKTAENGEIDQLPPIVYGIVPSGFKQLVPELGSPPQLVEGIIYEAGGPAVQMPKGFLRFTIRDDQIVRVPIIQPYGDN